MGDELCIKKENLVNRATGLLAEVSKKIDNENINHYENNNKLVQLENELCMFEREIYQVETEEDFKLMSDKFDKYIAIYKNFN